MNKKDENQLNDYIDNPTSQPAPDPQTAQVVKQLQQQAEQVEPRPQFVQELSSRLQAETRQSKTPRSFADWLVLRFVPRLVGATAIVGIIVLLAWGLPKLWQTWANPELEPVVSGDAVSVPHGLRADSTNPFPEVPSQLPLYQIEFEPIPTTPEEAVAWAANFGIPDPQAFTDPRQLGVIQVIGSNDESLTFQPFQPGGIIYSANQEWTNSLQTNSSTAEPLPFAEASDIAVNFLAAHDLLPAEYQVFDDEADGFESQDSLRSVSIGPYLADGYTFSGIGGAEATINIAADGQVLFAFLSFANTTPGEMVDIIPAQAAYEAYQAGELRSFGTETTMNDQSTPSFQTFSPPPPEYQVGDEVEVSGWPNVLVAAAGDEVRATLNVYPPGTYHLRGDKVRELADIEASMGDVVVRGVITAVLNPGEWELTVTDWEVGQPAYNSYDPFTCLKGAFSRETDGDWLTADEGTRYRLPDAPAELNEGDRVEVCAETTPIADTDVAWQNITRPPASEAAGMSESGMSMTAVGVAHEVVPMPAPTATGPEATSTPITDSPQTGMVTVEHNVTAVGGASGGGSFAGPIEAAAAQYELGESVTLTGTVDAYIFDEGDGNLRYQVTLQSLDELGLIATTLPLSATAAVIQEISDGYYGRFLRVTGEIVPYAGYHEWPMQAMAVESFTAVWPEATLKNYLGHMELETVEGVDTAVFVDHATDQRYHIAWEAGYFSENNPTLSEPQILISGIINPGTVFAGLPVLLVRGISYDNDIAQAEDASEFPLVTEPQVIPSGPYYDPMMSAEEMVLERMELTYYFEPTYDYTVAPSSPGNNPPLAAKQTARPVWVIHGRSPDGLTIYKIYVEATGK